MFDRILIANRGEIAVRIARCCRDLGVEVATVFSDADRRSRHVEMADEAVHLPGVAPSDTYLRAEAIVEAARATAADAIHPGYGFLAENAGFAQAVAESGLVWIGPPSRAMRVVGDKISARRLAESAGVPVLPGLTHSIEDPGMVTAFADEHGYPIAIKAAGGGGGRGLKVARSAKGVRDAFDAARRESVAYFGSSDVFVERYLDAPKHLEVQILSPAEDDALWLGVRDCSLQRRHQKLIEETPPPLHAEIEEPMGKAAGTLAIACGYVNAGTVEFLLDDSGAYYFLEVNARLQVEHTVTEEVLGVDVVAGQLKIAAGDDLGFAQDDLVNRGHAIECRINAEDPARDFVPTPGEIKRLVEPSGPGVRVDSGYVQGDEVPGAYDSLIAKVITHGSTREEARLRMVRALEEMVIDGVSSTVPAHLALLSNEEFVIGSHTTRTVEGAGALSGLEPRETSLETEGLLMVGGAPVRLWHPAMAASAAAAVGTSSGEMVAPMQGTILGVLVAEGDAVEAGDPLLVLETMKMETTIYAPFAGTVSSIAVASGGTVGAGASLALIDPSPPKA
jgi:acetyl-CoA/propionyl-CoA carboxylase biotin carboxyl carrier protein